MVTALVAVVWSGALAPITPGPEATENNVTVTKTPDPATVPETGGLVTFTIVVTSRSAVTVTSLVDSDFGDLDGQGTCDVPQILGGSGAVYECSFTKTIAGDFGVDHVDTVTVTASDEDGNSDAATDEATVAFTDIHPDITVTKTAAPATVPETGGSVTFTIAVTNVNAEAVTLTSLTDSDFGDLTGQGTCSLPQAVAGSGGTYMCSFAVTISGDFGVDHVDTVTAVASDDDGNADTATGTATVAFADVFPIVLEWATDKMTYARGEPVRIHFALVNIGARPVTLFFPDSCIYRFTVEDVNGKVWLGGQPQLCLQVISDLTFAPFERMDFSFTWSQTDDHGTPVPAPGTYFLRVAVRGYPLLARHATITIEA